MCFFTQAFLLWKDIFFTVFSCVWRHLLRGFCVVIDFCFQNCCFAKESFTFSKNLFFSKNDNRLKNVTQNRKKHEISAFCVFFRKSAKPFSRVIAFRRAALNCFFLCVCYFFKKRVLRRYAASENKFFRNLFFFKGCTNFA